MLPILLVCSSFLPLVISSQNYIVDGISRGTGGRQNAEPHTLYSCRCCLDNSSRHLLDTLTTKATVVVATQASLGIQAVQMCPNVQFCASVSMLLPQVSTGQQSQSGQI